MEWVLYVQEQLGPQQRVAPETQLKSASPSVTTETRYTNNGLDTPCRAGACPSSNRSVDINMGVSRALDGQAEGAKGLPESAAGITGEARLFIVLQCRTQRLACHAGHIAPSPVVTPRTLVLVTSVLHSRGRSQHSPAPFAVALKKVI